MDGFREKLVFESTVSRYITKKQLQFSNKGGSQLVNNEDINFPFKMNFGNKFCQENQESKVPYLLLIYKEKDVHYCTTGSNSILFEKRDTMGKWKKKMEMFINNYGPECRLYLSLLKMNGRHGYLLFQEYVQKLVYFMPITNSLKESKQLDLLSTPLVNDWCFVNFLKAELRFLKISQIFDQFSYEEKSRVWSDRLSPKAVRNRPCISSMELNSSCIGFYQHTYGARNRLTHSANRVPPNAEEISTYRAYMIAEGQEMPQKKTPLPSSNGIVPLQQIYSSERQPSCTTQAIDNHSTINVLQLTLVTLKRTQPRNGESKGVEGQQKRMIKRCRKSCVLPFDELEKEGEDGKYWYEVENTGRTHI